MNDLMKKAVRRRIRYGVLTFFIMLGLMSLYSYVFHVLHKSPHDIIYSVLAVVSASVVVTASFLLYSRKDYRKIKQYAALTSKVVEENKQIIEERYKLNQLWNNALLEASNDAIFIETLDGQIFDCNSAAVKLYGYTRDELITMHVKDLLTPKEARRINKVIANELKQGFLFVLSENVKKDGTVFPCEVSTRLVTINNESLAVAYVHDLTRQKESESIIRQSEKRYHTMIESFEGLIYICSHNYTVEYMNHRFIERTGFDGTGMPCYKALHERESICSWCVYDRVINGETVRRELCNPKDNRWYYVVNTPIHNEDKTISMQSVITDIDERKRSDEEIRKLNAELKENVVQLEYANNELESYSYTVSHDLKAPLVTIGGYAGMLQKKYSPVLDEMGNKFLNIISMDVNRLEGLINDLLELSRLRFHSIEKELIDVADLIMSITEKVFEKNRATIIVHEVPPVKADRKLLYQVFMNLISNAVKYSMKEKKPKIEIKGWSEGSELIYSVKDNGVGFDPHYCDRIFNAFQRLHSRNDYEGTGIGLNIVQRVVMYHNGRVWAESTPGKGAVFYISLPSDDTGSGLPV